MIGASLFLALAMGSGPTLVLAQDACPFLPAFKKLAKQLDSMSPQVAVLALEKYVVENDNPEACELFEVNKLLAEREQKLIHLTINGKAIPPQMVFRCNQFNQATSQCQSPMEDTTAHMASNGIVPAAMPVAGTEYKIESALPNANLISVYQMTLGNISQGKRGKRVADKAISRWLVAKDTSVLIAVFQSKGAWQYRKAVWYFDAAQSEKK